MWMRAKNNFVNWTNLRKNKVHILSNNKRKKVVATFQDAMKLTLIIGQIFALNPVTGVTDKKTSNIRFKWFSWRSMYCYLCICGQTFILFMCIYRAAVSVKFTLDLGTSIMFYGTSLITMLIFIGIARKWPKLVQHIVLMEKQDTNRDRTLVTKCNATCIVVLLLSLFEHILSLLSAFSSAICHHDENLHKGFVKIFYPWIFNFLPYSFLLGLLTQFLHSQSTFIWNFSDLFVICMSYYLTSRLEQVNKKLMNAKAKYLPEPFWRSLREEYCRVTDLVRRVDDVINGVIFISFANNLFFICLQLFNILEDGIKGTSNCPTGKIVGTPLKGYEQAVYFLFSLVFLISRSIAVSLIASQVHSTSMVPATVLYDVPSPVFCVEVQRFLDQVNTDNVALTGLQFFTVTKGLLLTVAGTIVTYELVMVQFNTGSESTVSNTIFTHLYNVTRTTAATVINSTSSL